MFASFNQLPDLYQGALYILFGTIVLLYALGIIEKGITILIVAFALYAITTGLIKIGLLKKSRLVFSGRKDNNVLDR